MHDPMVVAFEIPSPIPHREKWTERRLDGKRWGWLISRRTNDANLGERTYPRWRLRGRNLVMAGRCYGLQRAVTVWHVEPHGRDAFTVCKHSSHWKWHVWHWNIQVGWLQKWRRFALDRCKLCGQRFPLGYAPVSHQWDSPKSKHWWIGHTDCYHHECSSLTQFRMNADRDRDAIIWLVEAWRTQADLSHRQVLHALKRRSIMGPQTSHEERWKMERIQRALGWEYDTEREGYERDGEFVSMGEAINGAP